MNKWWWIHLASFGVTASAVVPAVAPVLSAVPVVGFILPAAATYASGAISHAIINTIRKNVDANFVG